MFFFEDLGQCALFREVFFYYFYDIFPYINFYIIAVGRVKQEYISFFVFLVFGLVFGSGSNGNEGVLRIPQSSNTAGTSPTDCLVSYTGHSLGGGSYPSAEVQSVYSTAPTDWAKKACMYTGMSFFKSYECLFL